MKMHKNLMRPITGIFQVPIASNPFKCCAKPILTLPGCLKLRTEKDYEEFLELLNKFSVRYVIIGSYALAFHARPRYTKDIDILVEPSVDNAKKIITVLDEFGFGSLDLEVNDFSKPGYVIQLGYEPVRIDIITSIEGLDFSEIWQNRVQGPYGNQIVNFINLDHLIKSKQLSNRTQDKADLELLTSEE